MTIQYPANVRLLHAFGMPPLPQAEHGIKRKVARPSEGEITQIALFE
jgi:hypothetical protein